MRASTSQFLSDSERQFPHIFSARNTSSVWMITHSNASWWRPGPNQKYPHCCLKCKIEIGLLDVFECRGLIYREPVCKKSPRLSNVWTKPLLSIQSPFISICINLMITSSIYLSQRDWYKYVKVVGREASIWRQVSYQLRYLVTWKSVDIHINPEALGPCLRVRFRSKFA